MNELQELGVHILAYLLGSIPFGLLLTRYAGLGDIRKIGSGNIGATNVLRTGHKGLAAATLLLDGAKGALAVLLAEKLVPGTGLLAGFAAVLGHMFPIWLKFKGGKGVATVIGVALAACWPAGLTAIGVWLLVAFISRYSSLAALVSIGLLPLYTFIFGHIEYSFIFLVMALFVVAKHKKNIRRLVGGTESRIGDKKNAEEEAP